MPIDAPHRTIRFHTEAFCQFHFAGAFEEQGEIVVDYVHYEDSRLLGALGDETRLTWSDRSTHVHGKLHRARIELRKRRLHSTPLWEGNCEYPLTGVRSGGEKYGNIFI